MQKAGFLYRKLGLEPESFVPNFSPIVLDVSTLHQASINRVIRPIYISELVCDGNETSLLDCRYKFMANDCDHLAVAGIKCTGNENTRHIGSLCRVLITVVDISQYRI